MTRRQAGVVRMLAGVIAASVVVPASGAAQEAAPLELRRSAEPGIGPGRVVAHPDPGSEAVAQRLEADVVELEQRARVERLLREELRPARPDLAPDVRSGIQQRNLQRLLTR